MPKTESSKLETLQYIQSMVRELKIMAEADSHGMLAYLLEMAYIEVSDSVRDEAATVTLAKLAVS